MTDIIIRHEVPGDIKAIADVVRDAFRGDTHGSHTEEFIIAETAQGRHGVPTLG